MKTKLLALILAAAMLFALAACSASEPADATPADAAPADTAADTAADPASDADASSEGVSAKVALITMDQLNVYWSYIHEGASARVEELNAQGNHIDYQWNSPEQSDNSQQIQKIEAAIADGVDYIVIACIDKTAENMALQEAVDAGIKIVYVDSPADFPGEASFATDNYNSGKMAGEFLIEQLQAKGQTEGLIGIVDGLPGSTTCTARYEGFAAAFEGTAYTLSERQYCEGDVAKAQEFANALVNNGAIALYSTDNPSANGAGATTADAQNNGLDVVCVGWDQSDMNISYVERGVMLGFMAQNPQVMGSDAIDAIVALENGEDLGGKSVDTGVTIVTADNVEAFK